MLDSTDFNLLTRKANDKISLADISRNERDRSYWEGYRAALYDVLVGATSVHGKREDGHEN